MEPIQTIPDYIREIQALIEEEKQEHALVLFRGESKEYPTPCQPNIFRKDLYRKDKFFEKNLFDEMRANHLTDGQSYLENAIDAQHDGFPSRLLDVTYNCLVALYFAITPYYKEDEKLYDGENGAVYVFFLDEMYCPTGKNIKEAYGACVERNSEWFAGQELFQKNHKLIDHIKKNPRIIAQQGAFILFQGDRLSSFPSYRYRKILIDKKQKPTLRQDLHALFGIHTGSIYPEQFNLVDEIVSKSKHMSPMEFTVDDEMKLIFINIRRLTQYYTDLLRQSNPSEFREIIQQVEEELLDYRDRLEPFLKNKIAIKSNKKITQHREEYNTIVEEFAAAAKKIMNRYPENAVEICRKELRLDP